MITDEDPLRGLFFYYLRRVRATFRYLVTPPP